MPTDNGPSRDVSPEGKVPNPSKPQPQPPSDKGKSREKPNDLLTPHLLPPPPWEKVWHLMQLPPGG